MLQLFGGIERIKYQWTELKNSIYIEGIKATLIPAVYIDKKSVVPTLASVAILEGKLSVDT